MRILIATVTAGAGHLAAAAALEEAWRSVRPRDVVERVDVLDFASKLYRKVYARGYVKVIEHAPEIYGMIFKKTDDSEKVRSARSFRRTFAHNTNKGFVRHLDKFQPDAVICVHYLPLEILGHIRATHPPPHPLTACVVTDFEAHAFWMEPFVDFYAVAAEETKASLAARGVPAESIVVTGIPIAPKFGVPVDKTAVRRRYGLRDDMPTLLVLGGGFGMGPVAEILGQLDKWDREFQTLVVAGRNADLRQQLAAEDRKHPTDVLGFCTNMNELMSVADLIITKPGGLTTSEAMAIGRPLCVLQPIPGQESANSDFLLERGAAIKVNRLEDLPFRLEQLFSGGKLAQMTRAAKELGRPQAARDICNALLARGITARKPGDS
jgi:processive 1,2-diacylglycerol beta-glucosyltransferase